jgi:ATP-dependent exoDNAse (exonuclease V) alpha subunit
VPADTVAKWLYEQDRLAAAAPARWAAWAPTPRTVLVVDEASMVGTHDLDRLTAATAAVGAKLVLVGDPAQIDPVQAAGGMLGLLADRLPATALTGIHRFTQAWERDASLRLRAGDPSVLNLYEQAGRIHPAVDHTTALDAVYTHWAEETAAGRDALMMARTRRDVDELNARARQAAIADGHVHGPVLLDGARDWRAGDLLRARRNDRTIPLGSSHVRNGDRFTVLAPTPDGGGLLVDDIAGRGRTRLPAEYVTQHADYGWASTVDGAQGATTDIGVLLATSGLDREHLYVGLTRGRAANHVHVAPDPGGERDEYRTVQATPFAASETSGRVLVDALATRRGQEAAHSRLPDRARVRVGRECSVHGSAPTETNRSVRSGDLGGRQRLAVVRDGLANLPSAGQGTAELSQTLAAVRALRRDQEPQDAAERPSDRWTQRRDTGRGLSR